MSMMSWARDMKPGHDALKHPVEAVHLGRARAGRNADRRYTVEPAQHEQIAGIDRHAEMDDFTARCDKPLRDDIAAIDDRRRTENEDRIETARVELGDRIPDRFDCMIADDDLVDASRRAP